MFYLNLKIKKTGLLKFQILKYILGQKLLGIVTYKVVPPY